MCAPLTRGLEAHTSVMTIIRQRETDASTGVCLSRSELWDECQLIIHKINVSDFPFRVSWFLPHTKMNELGIRNERKRIRNVIRITLSNYSNYSRTLSTT